MSTSTAAELPDSLQWVNTRLPPSLAASQGKVVVLLFWSISNTQSWKLLPKLRKLENKFENGLMTVGILCPKFPAEESVETALKAVNRLHIRFPVAIDSGFELWRDYSIKGWPSVAVIDAEGQLRQVMAGDHVEQELEQLLEQLLNDAARKDIRNYSKVPSAKKPEIGSAVMFPTAVLVARGLLYISDSGNNRILEVDKSGRVLRRFGSGNPGFWDGVLDNCGFNSPNGLAYTDNHLYVADTGNHALRRINLFSGEVETLVGTGKPGENVVRGIRELRSVALNIPTQLLMHGSSLFISVSGFHQIWRLNLLDGTIGWFCGSGQGEVIDGEALRCGFAQPQGMTVIGESLYVADADGCAIREVATDDGETQTRVGRGSFTFGDRDGIPSKALLQYPMDLAATRNGQEIWFADAFNHKLRCYDLELSRVTSPDWDMELRCPTSICLDDQHLWVADTDAHEIKRVDLLKRQIEKIQIVEGGH